MNRSDFLTDKHDPATKLKTLSVCVCVLLASACQAVALLCGFLTPGLFLFLFFALHNEDEMHILHPEVTASPLYTGMIMRDRASIIFIGCHVTVILEEENAYNMSYSARGRYVKNSSWASWGV